MASRVTRAVGPPRAVGATCRRVGSPRPSPDPNTSLRDQGPTPPPPGSPTHARGTSVLPPPPLLSCSPCGAPRQPWRGKACGGARGQGTPGLTPPGSSGHPDPPAHPRPGPLEAAKLCCPHPPAAPDSSAPPDPLTVALPLDGVTCPPPQGLVPWPWRSHLDARPGPLPRVWVWGQQPQPPGPHPPSGEPRLSLELRELQVGHRGHWPSLPRCPHRPPHLESPSAPLASAPSPRRSQGPWP